MGVGVRVGAASLEILAAHEARVNVYSRQRDGAQFLEIKIQQISIDGVQIGTHPILGIEHRWRLCVVSLIEFNNSSPISRLHLPSSSNMFFCFGSNLARFAKVSGVSKSSEDW